MQRTRWAFVWLLKCLWWLFAVLLSLKKLLTLGHRFFNPNLPRAVFPNCKTRSLKCPWYRANCCLTEVCGKLSTWLFWESHNLLYLQRYRPGSSAFLKHWFNQIIKKDNSAVFKGIYKHLFTCSSISSFHSATVLTSALREKNAMVWCCHLCRKYKRKLILSNQYLASGICWPECHKNSYSWGKMGVLHWQHDICEMASAHKKIWIDKIT